MAPTKTNPQNSTKARKHQDATDIQNSILLVLRTKQLVINVYTLVDKAV